MKGREREVTNPVIRHHRTGLVGLKSRSLVCAWLSVHRGRLTVGVHGASHPAISIVDTLPTIVDGGPMPLDRRTVVRVIPRGRRIGPKARSGRRGNLDGRTIWRSWGEGLWELLWSRCRAFPALRVSDHENTQNLCRGLTSWSEAPCESVASHPDLRTSVRGKWTPSFPGNSLEGRLRASSVV